MTLQVKKLICVTVRINLTILRTRRNKMTLREENNRLIAEFMGNHIIIAHLPKGVKGVVVRKNESSLPVSSCPISELKYHESWDWLVPAVEKWDKLDSEKLFTPSQTDSYVDYCDETDRIAAIYNRPMLYNQLIVNLKWLKQIKIDFTKL
jgi:hypothetical protein